MDGREQGDQSLIGVLIGDLSFDFTAELMEGITDAANAFGVRVVFLLGMQKHSAQGGHDNNKAEAINSNSVYDYAGLIGANAFIIACGSLSGFSGDGLYQQFLNRFQNQPCVVLQERVQIDAPQKTYIVVDNYHSFSQCIEHLIVDHGYRKIALVSGPEGHFDARERLRAYRDCMQRHQLSVTPEMIAYGDYYEYVDELVSRLMDQNPGLEAIAFANDEMAKAGYRECRRRGLAIGRDIAITGFDNFHEGRSMEPPLTTVSQDTYQMGKTALESAIRILQGETVAPLEMRTEFMKRHSCGCVQERLCLADAGGDDQAEIWIDHAILRLVESYASHFAHDERSAHAHALQKCFDHIRQLTLSAPEEPVDFEALSGYLNKFFSRYEHPTLQLSQNLAELVLQVLCMPCLTPPVRKFATMVSYMQQFIHTLEVRALEERYDTYRTQSWIAPELTRGLFGLEKDERVLRSVAERLITAGLRQVYICLLDKPQRYGRSGMATIPKRLRLAAYANVADTVAYARTRMPLVDARHPFRSLPNFPQARSMMGFSVFSGENQYGILLCEADQSISALLQVIGLQLGMLMDFLDLRRQEKVISEELEDIREKNEILNFLSEYDQLCGLLNRRGFIERAIRLNRENTDKTAYCVFVDLDYLKQINDTYGHQEGDVALRGVSAVLTNVSTEKDLIGRIGGDEFIGLFLMEDPWFEEHLTSRIHRECDQYNKTSGKPYLLDISVGIARFTCKQGVEVSSIIAEADKYLYEAKRKRVATALRQNPASTRAMDNLSQA